jgi:hypothetical protein
MKVVEALEEYTGIDVSHCLCDEGSEPCEGLICVYDALGSDDVCGFLMRVADILVSYATGEKHSVRMVYCREDVNEAGFEEVEKVGEDTYRVLREFSLRLGLNPTTLEELERMFFG